MSSTELFVDIVLGLLGLVALIVWVRALWDCSQRQFPNPGDRGKWILRIAVLPLMGGIIYWFDGRPQGWLPGEAPKVEEAHNASPGT